MPKTVVTKPRIRLRSWLLVTVCIVASVSTAWATRTVRRYLATDSRFVLDRSGLSIVGAKYASAVAIEQVFAPDYGRSLFDVPIAERRRRLLAIDWVENARVSRVWPNRVIVRVYERTPVAFVNVPHQAFLLVDGDGVLLSPPSRANFGFPVLNGVGIDQTEQERKARVQAALHMLAELGPAAKDISEVNAASPEDLRVTTEVKGRAVELLLGDTNFGSRYGNFKEHATDICAGSPRATVFDLRIDDRITAR